MTSSMNRRLIIWRHGQTTYNAEGRWQGQLDVPLSELGHSTEPNTEDDIKNVRESDAYKGLEG